MGHKKIMVTVAVGGLLVLSALVFVGVSYLLSSFIGGYSSTMARSLPLQYYGERRIATYPWTFSCGVRYTTDASRKEVLGYYDELLRREGWQVMDSKRPQVENTSQASASRTCGGSHDRRAALSLLFGTVTATGSPTSPPMRRIRTSRTTRPS